MRSAAPASFRERLNDSAIHSSSGDQHLTRRWPQLRQIPRNRSSRPSLGANHPFYSSTESCHHRLPPSPGAPRCRKAAHGAQTPLARDSRGTTAHHRSRSVHGGFDRCCSPRFKQALSLLAEGLLQLLIPRYQSLRCFVELDAPSGHLGRHHSFPPHRRPIPRIHPPLLAASTERPEAPHQLNNVGLDIEHCLTRATARRDHLRQPPRRTSPRHTHHRRCASCSGVKLRWEYARVRTVVEVVALEKRARSEASRLTRSWRKTRDAYGGNARSYSSVGQPHQP